MNELGYWIALSRIPGIGYGRLRLLKSYFGSLEQAWEAVPQSLCAAGLGEQLAIQLCHHRRFLSPTSELDRLEQFGITAHTLDDPSYPPLLAQAPDAPPVLYVRGTLPTPDRMLLAMVGTRRPSSYGRQVVTELVDGLVSSGVVTVSGLARGIDTMVHRETLEREGATIAVLAAGLDAVYPAENLSLARRILMAGALLSEHPPGVKLRKESFLHRNRIMSGLSRGTVVIEAGEHSGALATARNALDQNREVFAVPGSVFSPESRGTNRLIQRGEAKLILTPADILSEYGLDVSASGKKIRHPLQVDSMQSRIIAELGGSPVHCDDLARRLGISSREVAAALTLLELQGVIRDIGSMQYVMSAQWLSEVS